jgi:hypothetical protein
LGMYVESDAGCTGINDQLATVEVFPEPTANFLLHPFDSDDNDPNAPSPINTQWAFENLSVDNTINLWQFGDGATSYDESPSHEYLVPGVYGPNLIVTNDFGCTASHSEWLKVEEILDVYVPNSFTPGGMHSKPDGLNDGFRAEFRDLSLVKDFSLQIFDRWGELIWESSDPEEYWPGNVRRDGYESEYFVKLDVYTWKIRLSSVVLSGGGRELNGHVTILR